MDIIENEEITSNEDTTILWYIAYFSIFIGLLIPKEGRFAYYRGIFVGTFFAFISSLFSLPIILLLPKHPTSLWYLKYGGKMMTIGTGNSIEIRNGKSKQKGQGVVVLNHQSFIDIMGLAQIFEYYGQCVPVARKEVKYLVPLGTIISRPGSLFLDRKDKNASSSLANQATRFFQIYKDGKIMVFPEGTRNGSGTFLPFKKGAFRVAIDKQIPIYPCVISPYYFIKKNQCFNGGEIIISLLDPIETNGMTVKDTDSLIEKTQNIMMEEYNKLGLELKNRGRE